MAANYEKVREPRGREKLIIGHKRFNKLVEALNQQREKDDKQFEALEERIKKLEQRTA